MRVKMSKQPPPAPTASAVGPCPTVIQSVGRPGTGSLPSTIAPPDHPSRLWCLYWCLFVLSFFPRDVLAKIWDLVGSVSEGFPTYFSTLEMHRKIFKNIFFSEPFGSNAWNIVCSIAYLSCTKFVQMKVSGSKMAPPNWLLGLNFRNT